MAVFPRSLARVLRKGNRVIRCHVDTPRKFDGWFVTAVVVYFLNTLGWAGYVIYTIWSTP